MLRWSITLCRVAGIRLAVHWSLLVLLAYVAWEGWTAAGWWGAGWMLGFLSAAFACVMAHELGHAFAGRRFGADIPEILLLPIGGMAQFDHIPRNPRHEIAIALAGPAVNALVAGILLVFVDFPAHWDPVDFPLTGAELLRHLILMNLVMGLFNLLPVFPMDGGRVLRAALSARWGRLRATRWAVWLGRVLAVTAALVVGIGFENYLAVGLFVFVLLAGEMEYRSIQRAEQERVHWAEVMERFEREAALRRREGETLPADD